MDEQYLRDYILPLVEISVHDDGFDYEAFHGTCFLIGSDGFAVTSAHLLGVLPGNCLAALVVESGLWRAHIIEKFEEHPVEDVAILKLKGMKRRSFLRISENSEYSSCAYRQLAYPEDAESELVIDDRVVHRPDLIYLEGYIRRRVSNMDLPLRGGLFYELSEPGSVGCSGSPIIDKKGGDLWNVTGVYCGNRIANHGSVYFGVGYAVRSDAIADWTPAILGKPIKDEYLSV